MKIYWSARRQQRKLPTTGPPDPDTLTHHETTTPLARTAPRVVVDPLDSPRRQCPRERHSIIIPRRRRHQQSPRGLPAVRRGPRRMANVPRRYGRRVEVLPLRPPLRLRPNDDHARVVLCLSGSRVSRRPACGLSHLRRCPMS